MKIILYRERIQQYSIYCLFVLFMLFANVAMAQTELNGYVEFAAKNNPSLQAKFNEYMAALEVAPQVRALPDPQIAFAYFVQPVETRVGPQEFKISASQMFPWFGTLKAKENVAIQAAKAKYEIFEEAKSKLAHEVRSTYFNLYFNDKAVSITLENIEILTVINKLSYIKVEAGLVSAVDEYRIVMEINDLENQLALLKDKQTVLNVMFNNLLNADTDSAIVLPDMIWENDFTLSRTAALDSIKLKNHKLISISFQQQALSYRKEVARKLGRPSFNIGVDYTMVGKGDSNMAGTDAFVFPKVGITIPLYRSKYKAMINEVVYLETAKSLENDNQVNVLETLFETVWKDYRDANRRIDLYDIQLNLARKSLKLLETDYATANKNFEEILRMERRVLKYNLELEKAKSDKQANISFIDYLLGS